jgi:hypothetical protein
MRESRRSAAVVVGSPPLGLIDSLSVRKAKNQKLSSLENVELEPLFVLFDGDFLTKGYAALNLPSDDTFFKVQDQLLQTFPGMAHRRLFVSDNALPQFENLIPPGFQQAFLGYDRGAAVVVTRHESDAEAKAGTPLDCCCENPQTPHEYPSGRKKTGQSCDICPYLIEC